MKQTHHLTTYFLIIFLPKTENRKPKTVLAGHPYFSISVPDSRASTKISYAADKIFRFD